MPGTARMRILKNLPPGSAKSSVSPDKDVDSGRFLTDPLFYDS
jgi:hypothetical protein